MTEYLEIDIWHPRSDLIRQAARAIVAGQLVAVPTDTTIGIFCAYGNQKSVERLTRLRKAMAGPGVSDQTLRDKPMAMVFPNLSSLGEFTVLDHVAFKTVKRLLPGPFTIILPAARIVPKKLQTRRRSLGARFPDHPIVQALLNELKEPVLSTTAKTGAGELIGDAITVAELWPHFVDLVIDSGHFVPEPSTVLSFEDGHAHLIREGKGPIDDL